MYSYTSEIPYAANTGERANQLPDAAASIKQGHTHTHTENIYTTTHSHRLTHSFQSLT